MAAAGDAKYNTRTKSWAVRTVYPEDAFNAWGVMTVDRGGHYSTSAELETEDWLDVTVPTAP